MTDYTEYIDAYLQNVLPEDEKEQFKRLLSNPNSSLKDEMELQQEIILAVKKRGLREMLSREDNKLRIRRKGLIIVGSIGAAIATLSAAAVLFFVLVLSPLASVMFTESNQYAFSLDEQCRTGAETDTLSVMLNNASALIVNDNWEQADSIAVEVMHMSSSPLDGYAIEELDDYYQDAEWMHLNCLMHDKKTLSAIALLRKIAGRNGHFSEQAKTILNK